MSETNNHNLHSKLVCECVCSSPEEDAFDVRSAFKCWSRDTGDAVTLQVKVLQRFRQVGGYVRQLVDRQV